jgi:nucleotide-binding universal stress UspA family protein
VTKEKKILVGVDGSDGAMRAAVQARDLCKAMHGHLTLLHVIESLPQTPLTAFEEPLSDYYAKRMKWATEYLSGLAAELEVKTEEVIEMGRPSDVICREAHERGVDLVVVGSQGLSPGARLLLGSVGSRVASNASMSVLIVR